MGKNKILPLTTALIFFATNASATPEKSSHTLASPKRYRYVYRFNGSQTRNALSRNSQKLGSEVTRQLKLAQQFWSDRRWHSDGERMNRILQKLHLSAQQSRQAAAIRKRFQTEWDNLYQQVKNHRQEMRTLLATNTSSDRLRQDYRETRSLLERLGNNRFEMMMQIRKILTTEQRVRLIDLIGQGGN